MEENILVPAPEFKIYKERTIEVVTFLGGPLAGGYLMAENFRQMGDVAKSKNTMGITIISTALLIAALVFVPGIQRIPRYVIPLFYTLLMRFLVKKYQESAIRTHIKNGGPTFPIGRPVVIAIIGAVIFFSVTISVLLAIDQLGPVQPA